MSLIHKIGIILIVITKSNAVLILVNQEKGLLIHDFVNQVISKSRVIQQEYHTKFFNNVYDINSKKRKLAAHMISPAPSSNQ